MLKLIFWPKCCRRKANIVQSAVAQSSPSLNRREKQTIHQGGERFKTKKMQWGNPLKKKKKEVGGKSKSWKTLFGEAHTKAVHYSMQCMTKTQKYKEQKYEISNPWKCEPQFVGAVSTHIKGVQWKRPPHSWQPLNAKETLGGGDLFLTMGIAMCHKGG